MKKLAKILVLVLSVALVFGAVAFAIGAEGGPAYGYYTAEGAELSLSESLAEAFAGAYDGTVILQENIEISESLVIPEGKTFDLGNKKITNTANVFVFSLEGTAKITGEGHIQTVGGVITSTAGATLSGSGSGIYVKSQASQLFNVASGTLTLELCDIYTDGQNDTTEQIELNGSASLSMNNVKYVVNNVTAARTHMFSVGDGEVTQRVDIQNSTIDSTTLFVTIKAHENYITVANSYLDFNHPDVAKHAHPCSGGGSNASGKFLMQDSTYIADISAFYLNFGSGSTYVVELSNSTASLPGDAYSFFRGRFTVNLTNGTKIYTYDTAGTVWQYQSAPTVNAEAGVRFNVNPNNKGGITYPDGCDVYRYYLDRDRVYTYVIGTEDVLGVSDSKYNDYSGKTDKIDTPLTSDDGISFAHFSGYSTFSYLPDGKTIGLKYHLPVFVSDGQGGYVAAGDVTGTIDTGYANHATYVPPAAEGEDGQVKIATTRSYYSLAGSAGITGNTTDGMTTHATQVLSYKFGVYADSVYGMPDLVIQLTGRNKANTTTTQDDVLKIQSNKVTLTQGTKGTMAIEKGVVNHFELIYHRSTSRIYAFVNGQYLGEYSGGAANVDNYRIDGALRCRIGAGTFNENASFSFVYSSGYSYNAYLGESFDINDYVTYFDDLESVATVNGIGYPSLSDAVDAAHKLGSVVNLIKDIPGTSTLPVGVGGYIVTNGYSVNISTELSVNSYNDAAGNTVYYVATPLTVNWNYGKDNSEKFSEGYELGDVPTAPAITSYVDGFGGLLKLAGWASVNINPADYDSFEEYKAAADAVTLTGFAAVTSTELSAGLAREYYAVYETTPVVATVTGADGSVEYIATLSDLVKYLQDDFNNLIKNNDTLKLFDDVTITPGIEGANGVQMNIKESKTLTLDLNGHTVDFGASGGQFTIGAMNSVNGVSAFTHGKSLGLNVLSSVPGAKLLSKSNIAIFGLNGAFKTFNFNGENIYVEAPRFLDANAQGGSNADGRNTTININGGTFRQILTGSGHSFIRHYGNVTVYQATINISNATFISDAGAKAFLRVDGGAKAYDSDSSVVRDAIVFTNCDITLEGETRDIVWAPDHNAFRIVFNGCDIVNGPNLGSGYGKIVLGEGTTFTYGPSAIKKYDDKTAAELANPALDTAYTGVYLGAADLGFGRLGEGKWQVVKASELVEYSFVEPNGDAIGTEKYISGTAPFYAGNNHNEYKTLTLVFNGWAAHESEANTYVAQYTVGGKGIETQVSAFLYTELGVNLYIPADVAALLAEGSSEFVDAGDGYFRATVSVPANLAFSGASFTLKFNEETIAGVKSVSYSTTVPVAQYAAMILGGEFSENEKDLMYYMLTYLDAAYKYMTIGEAETAAIAKLGYADAASAFAAAIGEYQPVTAREGEATEYTGETLGLNISVDLQASPVFVINTENEAIAKVVINGVQVVDGKFEIGNVYNFDRTLNITTYNAEGEVLTSGTFCYANYLYAAENSGDATVAAVADALYSYILAAKAFGNK